MRVPVRSVGSAVRNSHQRGRPGVGGIVAGLVGLLLVAACTGAAPPASPVATPAPTPMPTPNPHLAEPASVEAVFTWLNGKGLRVIGNNADRGTGGEPLKRINATYAGWPLILSEYSSGPAARKASGVAAAETQAAADQPEFTFVGLNVVVDFGPRLLRDGDPPPDPRFVAAATALAVALDPLLGPLGVRAAVHVALPAAASAAPSPTASPQPSPKPSARTSPKPSTRPKATTKPKVSPTPSG
jgi:hypothetical protein